MFADSELLSFPVHPCLLLSPLNGVPALARGKALSQARRGVRVGKEEKWGVIVQKNLLKCGC